MMSMEDLCTGNIYTIRPKRNTQGLGKHLSE